MSNNSGPPRNLSNWLPNLLGPLNLQANGADFVTRRQTINFTGGITVTDDPDTESTVITISGGGGSDEDGPVIDNNDTGTLASVASTSSGTPARATRYLGVAPVVEGIQDGALRKAPLVQIAVGGPLVFKNQSSGATADERLITGTGGDLTVAQGSAALLFFDPTTQRWIVVAVGNVLTPAGNDGDLQAKNGTALEAATWNFDSGTGALTAAKGNALKIKNDAGTGAYNVAIREGTGSAETVTYNGDLAGDATASAPNAEILGTASVYVGMNDSSAFVEPNKTGTPGIDIFPNATVGPAGHVAHSYGGGTGILNIHTTVEPSIATATPLASGVSIFEDAATAQLLTEGTRNSVGDIAPLSPVYTAVTFSGDADQNLTSAQARATHLAVASGTITATRTLTNTAMPPTTGHAIYVRNNNAQSVKYAWSSGTAATIAATSTAIVTGDGTNAVLMSSMPDASGSGLPSEVDGKFLTGVSGSWVAGNVATFYGSTGTNAAAGLLRGANNTTLVAAKNNAGSADNAILATGTSDQAIIGDGTVTGNLSVNMKTGSQANFQIGGSTGIVIVPAPTGAQQIQSVAGATSFTIKQNDNTTNSATAAALTIQAPNATGTSATGGDLNLTSGTGTAAGGNVNIQIGGSGRLQLTPTRATGDIIADGGTILARFARGSNSTLLGVSSGGTLGYAAATLPQGGTGLTAVPGSSGQFIFNSSSAYGATGNFTYDGTGAVMASAGYLKTGAGTQPSTGTIRQGNTSSTILAVRGASADLPMLCNDSGTDGFTVGVNPGLSAGAIHTTIGATSDVTITTTAATGIKVNTTDIAYGLPRHGSSTPYSSDGEATLALSGTAQTLLAAVYSRSIWLFTGPNAATDTITVPAPADADHSYVKQVRITSTNTDLNFTTGTGHVAGYTSAGFAAGDEVRLTLLVTPEGCYFHGVKKIGSTPAVVAS